MHRIDLWFLHLLFFGPIQSNTSVDSHFNEQGLVSNSVVCPKLGRRRRVVEVEELPLVFIWRACQMTNVEQQQRRAAHNLALFWGIPCLRGKEFSQNLHNNSVIATKAQISRPQSLEVLLFLWYISRSCLVRLCRSSSWHAFDTPRGNSRVGQGVVIKMKNTGVGWG